MILTLILDLTLEQVNLTDNFGVGIESRLAGKKHLKSRQLLFNLTKRIVKGTANCQ